MSSEFERARSRVIEAAVAWRREHWFSGVIDEMSDDQINLLDLVDAVDACVQAGIDAGERMVWIERTMSDVRVGDTIRPADGTGSTSTTGTQVTDRYLPPDPKGVANAGSWHVVAGATNHWSDHVVQPGEVWLCMNGGKPRNLDPGFPVEILMPADWMAAATALGVLDHDAAWANRLDEGC